MQRELMAGVRGLFKRLGLIAVIACTLFVIGKIVNVVNGVNPQSQTVALKQPSLHNIPLAETNLAAPLTDPLMTMALEEMRALSGPSDKGLGAQLTFQTSSGPVTLYENQVSDLNQRYKKLAMSAPE